MHRRLTGLVKDAWWLAIVVVAAAVAVGIMIDVTLSIMIVVACAACFIYFAIMRYDDSGKEHGD